METTVPATSLDVAQLDSMAALLSRNGIAFTTTDEALRCELSVAGKAYATVYLIPAVSVFADIEPGSTVGASLEVTQERILGPEYFERTTKSLHLLVVGTADFLSKPDVARATVDVVHNLSYAKKEVLTPEDALEWLRRPFFQLEGAQRANAAPFLATVADLRQESLPAATQLFDLEATLRDSEEPRHMVRELASKLYRRCMGSEHKVFWVDGVPELGRSHEEGGMEATYCSSGERIAFAVSLFMARAMMDVTPGMCIGFHNSFDRMDTLRQVGAYDCLREFIAATGASVLIHSAKESLRQLAGMRIKPVIEALGGQVTDYERLSY